MTYNFESLNEDMTPKEQAARLGLTYGGFGGWVDANRKVVARTVDGKLVRVDDKDEAPAKDLGNLIVLTFPSDLAYADRHHIPEKVVAKFNQLLKGILKFEGAFIIFTARGEEKTVAKYLLKAGITTNVKLVPLGSSDPNKKRTFIEKKIKGGYRDIQFFDQDKKAIAAVESLKAPFNKLDIQFKIVPLPPLSQGPRLAPTAAPASGEQEKKAA